MTTSTMGPRPAVSQPDYLPGDPVRHVLGKPEEKPARVHRPQPPKPARVPTAEHIRRDIQRRMTELAPLVAEYPRLVEAYNRLKRIK